MAKSYDGSDFVGLDDEAVEAVGSVAQPWDAWLDAAISSNTSWLERTGDSVGWAPITNNAGDYNDGADLRPHTSVASSTILCLPWCYNQGMTGVGVGLVARVAQEDGEPRPYLLKLEKRDLGLSRVEASASTVAASTEAASPQFQDFKPAVTFSQLAADDVGALVLWGLGVESSASVANTLGGGEVFRPFILRTPDDAAFYADSSSSRPNAEALDIQATRIIGGGAGPGASEAYDHLGVLYDAYPGPDNEDKLMQVYPPARAVPNQLDRRGLSYIQIKGGTFRQIYEDEAPDPTIYRAQVPLLGEVEVIHALRQDAIYTRPRLLWVGPQGALPDPESNEWPQGYHYRFNRIYGDNTVSFRSLAIGHIQPNTVNPKILFMAYVAPLHLSFYDQLTQDERTNLSPLLSWDVRAQLLQMQDGAGSWAEATILGEWITSAEGDGFSFAHQPVDPSFALGLSEGAILYPYGGGAAGSGYAYKEGQLFENDLSSLSLIAGSIDATVDEDNMFPIRINIEARPRVDVDWGNVADARRVREALALVTVGVTVWELPQ